MLLRKGTIYSYKPTMLELTYFYICISTFAFYVFIPDSRSQTIDDLLSCIHWVFSLSIRLLATCKHTTNNKTNKIV